MTIVLPKVGALALGLALISTGTSATPAATETPVQLVGVWKLNKELSDNPGAKMIEAMRDRSGPGGGAGGMDGDRGGEGGGGGAMGGGGGRGGGRGGDAMTRARGRGGMAMLGGEPPLDGSPDAERAQGPGDQGQRAGTGNPPTGDRRAAQGRRRARGPIPSPQFTIEQDGDNLAFRTEGNLRLLHSDGQKRKKEGPGGKIEIVTRFQKGALVVESRPEMGGKRKETYTLLADGKLQIKFDLEGSGPMSGVKFKLVYDAAPAAQF